MAKTPTTISLSSHSSTIEDLVAKARLAVRPVAWSKFRQEFMDGKCEKGIAFDAIINIKIKDANGDASETVTFRFSGHVAHVGQVLEGAEAFIRDGENVVAWSGRWGGVLSDQRQCENVFNCLCGSMIGSADTTKLVNFGLRQDTVLPRGIHGWVESPGKLKYESADPIVLRSNSFSVGERVRSELSRQLLYAGCAYGAAAL